VTKASGVYFYKESTLQGEELTKAISTYSGITIFGTTNADGTPNMAVAIPGVVEDDVLILALADNRTRKNIAETKTAMMVFYRANPDATDRKQKHSGARLQLQLIDDEPSRKAYFDKLKQKNQDAKSGGKEITLQDSLFLRITKVIPLG
jgi:hypothetical protein